MSSHSVYEHALIQIVDRTGTPLCQSGIDGGPDLRTQEAASLATGRFGAGRFVQAPGGTRMLPVFQPIATAAGPGVICAAIDLGWLARQTDRFAAAPAGQIVLEDAGGRMLLA